MRTSVLLVLLAAAEVACQPEPTRGLLDDPLALVGRLDQLLDRQCAEERFSGVVALARADSVLYRRACGYEDREAGLLNTPETAFNLGSINKLFTAIAIRQLEARGLVHRDSTLDAYLPDYPNRDVATRVTIGQLLQHRSGVAGDIFAAPAGRTRGDIRHNRDYVQLFAVAPLAFEPGTDQRYSNAGYILLGEIVTAVSGMDYYDYVRRHIYEPAAMVDTEHHASDELPRDVARGYTRGEGSGGPARPNTDTLPGRGSAAGGGYSTASDLLGLVSALRAGRIEAAPPAGIGVAGGAPGINAVLEGDLPGGYDLVVLANLDPPAAEVVARSVRDWLGATD